MTTDCVQTRLLWQTVCRPQLGHRQSSLQQGLAWMRVHCDQIKLMVAHHSEVHLLGVLVSQKGFSDA